MELGDLDGKLYEKLQERVKITRKSAWRLAQGIGEAWDG